MSPEQSDGMERWAGGIDHQLIALASQIAINAQAIGELQSRMTQLQIEMAAVRTKIGVWSALGGLVGSAIVGLVIALVTG